LVLLVVALFVGPAASGFDPTITAIFTIDFTPDVVIDFEDLAIGEILESGDPVAPGVTFGGAPGATQQAIVVDTGGGNRALQQVDFGQPGNPNLTAIAFTLADPARSAAAQVHAIGSSMLNPMATCYGAGGDILSFVSIGGAVDSFFGFRGQPVSTPIGVLTYDYAADEPSIGMTVDNLAIQFAPEPGAAATALAAMASVAPLARRRATRG
jgi:hypothetical protein